MTRPALGLIIATAASDLSVVLFNLLFHKQELCLPVDKTPSRAVTPPR